MRVIYQTGAVFTALVVYIVTGIILSFLGVSSLVCTVFSNLVLCMFCLLVLEVMPFTLRFYRNVRQNHLSCVFLLFFVWLSGQTFATWYYTQFGDASFDLYSDTLQSHSFLLYVVLVVFLAPLTEELFVRGLLFGLFQQFLPVWVSAVVSSFLFALFHGTAVHFYGAFLAGLCFTFAYQVTHRLTVAVLLHAVYNAYTVIQSVCGFRYSSFFFSFPFVVFLAVVTVCYLGFLYYYEEFVLKQGADSMN